MVAVTLHDGVGNQLFQFSFASLLSQALGAHQLFLDPMQLVASGSPRLQKGQVKRSAGSERMLRTMFPAGFGEENSGSRAVEVCRQAILSQDVSRTNPVTTIDVSDISRKWRQTSKNFFDQWGVLAAMSELGRPGAKGKAGAPNCILVDGYFQQTWLYEAWRPQLTRILRPNMLRVTDEPNKPPSGARSSIKGSADTATRSVMRHPALPHSSMMAPGHRDAVLHVRTCESNRPHAVGGNLSRSFYPSLPFEFYATILARRSGSWKQAWIVAPLSCTKSLVVSKLKRYFPGRVHLHAAQERDGKQNAENVVNAAISDLFFLMATRNMLILSVGSFSFWSGYLSNASEVGGWRRAREQGVIECS